jgi:hypothetical protein
MVGAGKSLLHDGRVCSLPKHRLYFRQYNYKGVSAYRRCNSIPVDRFYTVLFHGVIVSACLGKFTILKGGTPESPTAITHKPRTAVGDYTACQAPPPSLTSFPCRSLLPCQRLRLWNCPPIGGFIPHPPPPPPLHCQQVMTSRGAIIFPVQI